MELIKRISGDNFSSLLEKAEIGDEIILYEGQFYGYRPHESEILVYTQDMKKFFFLNKKETTKDEFLSLSEKYNNLYNKIIRKPKEGLFFEERMVHQYPECERFEFDGNLLYLEINNEIYIKDIKNPEKMNLIYKGPKERRMDKRWWWRIHPLGLLINLYDNNLYLIHILRK